MVTRPLGTSYMSQGPTPLAKQEDPTIHSTSQAEAVSVRRQKLQHSKSLMRTKTSSATLMRTELNKLQHVLSRGPISLDDLAYRSTSAKGDFIIQPTPMHRDNPTKTSRQARLSTTPASTTTTQAPSVKTMLNRSHTLPKGVSQLRESTSCRNDAAMVASPVDSDNPISRTGTPSTTKPGVPSAFGYVQF